MSEPSLRVYSGPLTEILVLTFPHEVSCSAGPKLLRRLSGGSIDYGCVKLGGMVASK